MQLTRLLRIALLAALISACAPLPQLPSCTRLPVVQVPSANFSERRPGFVVLHHTGSADANRALDTLTRSGTEVSAHYLVGRDGKLYNLFDELKRAWHTGPAYWGGEIDMNSASIGIELDNDGAEPYADAQIETLLALLADLKERYRIPSKLTTTSSTASPVSHCRPAILRFIGRPNRAPIGTSAKS